MIFDGEIASRPTTSPTLDLPGRHANHHRRFVACDQGLRMKEQRQAISLHILNGHGAAVNRVDRGLQEIVGKVTTGWLWSWHRGFPAGVISFKDFTSFYQTVDLTTTLFLKRTT
jgi:hypothetical protein